MIFAPGTTSETSGSWERILGEETLEVILTESLDPAPGLDYIPIERLRDVPMSWLRSDDLWSYNNYPY